MKTFSSIVRTMSRAMYFLAGLALTFSIFLTVADVCLRSVKRPIVGTYELVGLMGALVVGLAIPQTSRLKGHVVMDFLTANASSGLDALLHILTRLLGTALFFIISVNLLEMGRDLLRTGETTLTLHIPMYPLPFVLAFCCLVECLVLTVELFDQREPGA
jgi:TRAP-type C4-dicarboxylate transport system permease small subunit